MVKFIKVFNEYVNINSINKISFDEESCRLYYAKDKVLTIRVNALIPGNEDAKETIEGIKRFLEKNLI